jgi:hypothetical protein
MKWELTPARPDHGKEFIPEKPLSTNVQGKYLTLTLNLKV